MKKKIIQFGAGNIGRSFIGQLFSSHGYEVVFIDINEQVINELNRRRSYEVVIKQNDKEDIYLRADNVRGVLASDTEQVIREIMDTDLISTSVGKNALTHIMQVIASGIINRFSIPNARDLNIILAENMMHGKTVVTEMLSPLLGEFSHYLDRVGIIETSIGKMVPIMPKEITDQDPLVVYGEPYRTLIIDRKAFKGPLPEIPSLKAVDPIGAYVDRKLFIHNLGHAATAYLGYRYYPDAVYLYEVLEDPALKDLVRAAMSESAAALMREYPDVFTEEDLNDHIDDLLNRFSNRALKDTIYRVGRDLNRKLNINDRVLGAASLCLKHHCSFHSIIRVFSAALHFQAVDQAGAQLESDRLFLSTANNIYLEDLLKYKCYVKDEKLCDSIMKMMETVV